MYTFLLYVYYTYIYTPKVRDGLLKLSIIPYVGGEGKDSNYYGLRFGWGMCYDRRIF